jgi:glycosyltransferase involved in cell wall biosynthesis
LTNKKLNILIVCEHASNQFGGEAVLPLNYFKLLSNTPNTVFLLTHSRTKQNLDSISELNHQHIYYIKDTALHQFFSRMSRTVLSPFAGIFAHLWTQFLQYLFVRKIVKEHQIDVVHEVAPVSPRQPSMMFGLGAPVVIGPMNGGMSYPIGVNYLETKSHTSFAKLARLFASLANVVIPGKLFATTLVVANQRTRAALPKLRLGQVVELVENGVFTVKEKLPPIENKETLNVIFAGRLVDWKAVDILIDAVSLCKSSLMLTIVGDGSERAFLEDYAKKQLGTRPNIKYRFVGMAAFEEMNQHYDQADMFALPSLYECGGAVVLEAMSRGLPVIATDWGGPSDYITDGSGCLVAPKSRDYMVTEFARIIDDLARSPSKRQEIGAAAIARVKAHFMWDVKIKQMLEIYQKAINQ